MQIERIRLFQSSTYRSTIADKVIRDEKGTLLDDAVSLDTEQREQKEQKNLQNPQNETKEDLGSNAQVPQRREGLPLDIIA